MNESIPPPGSDLLQVLFARDFLLFVVGAGIGWAITAYYNWRSTQATRSMLAEAKTVGLSVGDLHTLLTSRVIDVQNPGPFPFKSCPVCGSTDIEKYDEDNVEITDQNEDGSPEYTNFPTPAIKCNSCSWSKGIEQGGPLGI